MIWMPPSDPRPKEQIQPYQPFIWPSGHTVSLVTPEDIPQSFCDVVAARRSNRKFGPLTLTDISSLLWYSSRVLARRGSALGFDLSQRPTPSAGAIHPIHVLACSSTRASWQRYDPEQHCLTEVSHGVLAPCDALAQIGTAIDPQKGTLLWLAAEVGKTASKYESPESLIWRDAGALIAHLGLVASYLGLHFCALGATGARWGVELNEAQLICGVGAALVGTPPCTDISGHDTEL